MFVVGRGHLSLHAWRPGPEPLNPEPLSPEPSLEREIKLRFESADAARAAVAALGATPLRGRRLQDDVLLDTDDRRAPARAAASLRVRARRRAEPPSPSRARCMPSAMKVREEIETVVGDAEMLLRVLRRARASRRASATRSIREEFALDGRVVAIDETPVGTFVELEGDETAIADVARGLGRTPGDYVLASYRSLFLDVARHAACTARRHGVRRRRERLAARARSSSPPASARACSR